MCLLYQVDNVIEEEQHYKLDILLLDNLRDFTRALRWYM